MEIFDYAIKNKKEILTEFKTNEKKGLSKTEVEERLKLHGHNLLLSKKVNGLAIFVRQFKSAFIYLLLAAIAITLALGEYVDSIMIFIFLTVNTSLGFFQEYGSEKTVQMLNKYATPRSKVLRNGKEETISAEQLVPGDIIILEAGDKVPADSRILEQNDFVIDETILTGESISVHKDALDQNKKPTAYFEAQNLVFSGTSVLNGKATAIILATGKKTAFGKIAKLATEARRISDFEKGINSFANFILKLVGVTILIVLIANLLIKRDGVNFIELIIFTIALTVSVIPEALPLVTTFSLSNGAKKLAKKHVIVKRLSAVEDLGGIEILCTDKTGTLTKNELVVANILSDKPDETLMAAYYASAFEQKKKLEPFDIAIWNRVKKEVKMNNFAITKLKEEPFNPTNKRNVVLMQANTETQLVTRGAYEVISDCCVNIVNKQDKNKIEKWIQMEGEQGHRTLVVARKKMNGNDKSKIDLLKVNDYEFLGVISFVDTIKPSAHEAVEDAKKLGVKIKIITGDSPEVAGAVACEVGLIDSPDKVLTGAAWFAMDKNKQLEALEQYFVFARVSPEQKYSMIETLRDHHMVGFLGEGINDAPALKIAGVSLVVDSASDIAREAADIALLRHDLKVIIDGIKEGRTVFANTTKYIKSTLISNFGNFFAVATASFMIDFLPMLPIQILLLNLLSDTPMILVSTDTVDHDELVSPKKYEVKDIIIIAMVLGVLSTIFDFIFFGLFYKSGPEILQTNWFIGSVLTELTLIFSIRTKFFCFKANRPSTSLIIASIFTFIATISLPFTSFGQKIFHFSKPSVTNLLLILTVVAIYFICTETLKILFYKKMNGNTYKSSKLAEKSGL